MVKVGSVVKLIILDLDGVMNDGKKYYDHSGKCVLKQFCDKDFTAIKRLKASRIEVVFLSGDPVINETVANNRNIEFYNARNKPKLTFLTFFKKRFGVSKDEMCFVGDDLFDLPLLKAVGHPYCPLDACHDVLEYIESAHGANNIIKQPGGHNVIEELYSLLQRKNLVKKTNLEDILQLDAKEVF